MKQKVLINRTKQWWRAKAGYLCSLLLFLLAVSEVSFIQGSWLLFLAITAILGIGMIGHLINDFSDIEPDRIAGKPNMVATLGKGKATVSFLLFLGLGYSPWFFGFQSNLLIRLLLVAELLLFLVYSFPPFRFKKYPLIAVIMDAIYAYVNPALFLWLSFQCTIGNAISSVEIMLLVGIGFPLGIRHILNHHVVDRTNDEIANSPNIAVNYGSNNLYRVVRYFLLPIEVMSVFAFLLVIGGGNVIAQITSIIGFALVILLSGTLSFPFMKVRFGELLHDRFYTQLLGLIAIGVLISQELAYLVLLPLFLVVFTNIFQHPIWSWFLQEGWAGILIVVKWPFQMGSLMFNWSLYYFRKWVLRWSEKRNWGTHYEKRLRDLYLDSRGNVAIFNQNKSKFSETFIEGQKEALDYRMFYYYGFPRPLINSVDGHLVEPNVYIRKLKYGILDIFNVDRLEYENNTLCEHLLSNKVSVMVAHFGPMGVELRTVANKTGIPLVVVFHGYDAWNKTQIETNEAAYAELFKTAPCLVGVSKDICLQLEKLGCPISKINYLPAYFNPERFPFVERKSSDKMVFLSVGRFSKTKAPMIVISAFAKLLEQYNAAELVMIGADDGEGLFEASIMHARMLGVEDRINFMGAQSAEVVRKEMSGASVFLQHSVTTPVENDKEGTPISVLEAMATGLPVLATNHAGIAEMITDGETGLLVQEYDVEAMCKQMLRLAGDSDLRRSIGKKAAESVRSNRKITKNIELFSEMLDKHKLVP